MKYRFAPFLIAGVMFVIGGCGLVYEYALGFLGNNLIGSSHEQFYLVIAIMMFAMGVGAYIQESLFKRHLMDKFLYVEITLALLGGFSVLLIYTAYAFMAHYTFVLHSLAFLMGLLIGAEIPLIMRINKEQKQELCPKLNVVLGLDYVGALLGAIVFIYFMLPRISIDKIVFTLALVNAGVGIIAMIYFWKLIKRKKVVFTYACLVVAALVVSFSYTKPIMTSLEQRTYEDPIVFTQDSPYQHLVITRSLNDDTRLYINGQLQFSSRDEHIYHEMLVHVPMSVAKKPRNVLILGGGDGMALREVLKYDEVESVTLVDLDPIMTEIFANKPELRELNGGAFDDARVYFSSGEGITPGDSLRIVRESHLSRSLIDSTPYQIADVRVINVDADTFLRSVVGKYDLVIVDFPDPSMLELCKLYSVDFYRTLRSRLTSDAVMAIQSTSPYHAREVFLCIGQTLRAAGYHVLPYQQTVPSFGPWGWHLAWISDQTPHEVLDTISRTPIVVDTQYITSDVAIAAFVFGQDQLAMNNIRANTKMYPVILEYYRRSWQR